MNLSIAADGTISCIYSEELDLQELGKVQIKRASHVEPTEEGKWTADLTPVGGPVLGVFATRSEAIAAEITWLDNWLDS